MSKELTRQQQIERSIIKKFKKPIWNNFIGAIKDYELIKQGDRIAVCISGGKDSMLLAKCFQELIKYTEIAFEVEFILMNPGYNEENLNVIHQNLEILGIQAHIFEAPIFDYVVNQDGSPCYLCARMRRGYLYKEAKKLSCNKIALGHHFDDVIETTLLSILYAAEIKTMMPKLKSTNFEGLELIRPLYMVKENDIIHWTKYNDLNFIRCACRFTEEQEYEEDESGAFENGHKRKEIKELIKKLRETSPYIDMNIFRSVHNVNLSTIIGYRNNNDGDVHSFLDNY